ncbi:MAG: TonB-dependent receptor plug domain-containing protein, partial [Asticcacaulis sp.]
MIKKTERSLSHYLKANSGLGVSVLALMMAMPVQAQVASTAQDTDITEVVVVGARAAQQSAIDRKKRATTPTDSIVADDVGAFPDRNLNEAISRIAGVALNRNDNGEGDGISIRGNGPDLTRVEIDGMGVQSAKGGLATGGTDGDGRGADMRELPSDLIKSVDVVKGSTADMTEGSLGGGVIIQTRTGLDFKKPYFSMRVGAQQNSVGRTITPDFNIVASRKFFNNRLGVIFSVTSSKVENNSHAAETVTSGSAGYARSVDWDGSPEKTFSFNPDTVSGDVADLPAASWSAATNDGSTIGWNTPRQIVTLASQAQTKADCNVLFPFLPQSELDKIANNTNQTNRAAAQAQRTNERISCLNQWNDYHPSLIRNFMNSQTEERLAADIRFDFRVNDNLSLYAKYAIANRDQDEQRRLLTPGGVTINRAGMFTDSLATNTDIAVGTGNVRSAIPGSGYYGYNTGYATGTSTLDRIAGSTRSDMAFPIIGQVVNVDPATVVMDENHHVTEFTVTDGILGKQQTSNDQISNSTYITFGGEYRNGPLKV